MAIITDEEDCKYYMYRISLKEDPTKGYVGVSSDYKRRWRQHRNDAKNGNGYYIANALGKHGVDAFDWKVIAIFRNGKIAGDMEQIAKQFLGLGYYNLTDGGEGLLRPSPESRKKKGDAIRKTMEDPARRKARSEALKAFHRENPEAAEKKAEHLRAINKDPEIAAKRNAALAATLAANPEILEKRNNVVRAALSKPETRTKMSETHTKRFEDPALRQERSDMINAYWARTGPCPESTRKKIGDANRGRPKTPEQIEQWRETYQANKEAGNHINGTPESSQRRREAQIKRQAREASEGRKPLSDEARKRMSDSQKARFAREKAEKEKLK
jgi:hypothetical protein